MGQYDGRPDESFWDMDVATIPGYLARKPIDALGNLIGGEVQGAVASEYGAPSLGPSLPHNDPGTDIPREIETAANRNVEAAGPPTADIAREHTPLPHVPASMMPQATEESLVQAADPSHIRYQLPGGEWHDFSPGEHAPVMAHGSAMFGGGLDHGAPGGGPTPGPGGDSLPATPSDLEGDGGHVLFSGNGTVADYLGQAQAAGLSNAVESGVAQGDEITGNADITRAARAQALADLAPAGHGLTMGDMRAIERAGGETSAKLHAGTIEEQAHRQEYDEKSQKELRDYASTVAYIKATIADPKLQMQKLSEMERMHNERQTQLAASYGYLKRSETDRGGLGG